MGSVMHPRGPAGAQAYWRRRVVVFTLLAAFGGVVLWSSGSPASKSRAAADGSPAATAQGEFDPGSKASPGLPECAPENLVFSVAGEKTVAVDGTQSLVMTVTNADTVACVADLGPEAFSLRITSGKDPIWSTMDCPEWGPNASPSLDPNGTWQWTTTWPVQRSRQCDLLSAKLGPGTYVASASVVGSAVGKLVMQLR